MKTTAKQPKAPATRLSESVSVAVSSQNVDRTAGVMRGVMVVQNVSKNGRRYLQEALNAAAHLYEGKKVYLDHSVVTRLEGKAQKRSSASRSLGERWGRIVNVKEAAGGGLQGDLEYLKTHRLTEPLLEAAERFGDFGLSHDAMGDVRKGADGVEEVYRINAVESVDVVNDPATNRNFFESEEPMARIQILAALREHVTAVPAVSKLAQRLTEDAGLAGVGGMEMDAPEEGCTPEQAVQDAITAAVVAIMKGEGDTKSKLDKLKTLLDINDTVAPSGSGTGGGLANGDAGAMSEQVQKKIAELEASNAKLQESLQRHEAEKTEARTREACVKLLTESKREVTDIRVSALMKMAEADRKPLVESWDQIVDRPTSSRSKLQEQLGEGGPIEVKDHDSLKKLLNV